MSLVKIDIVLSKAEACSRLLACISKSDCALSVEPKKLTRAKREFSFFMTKIFGFALLDRRAPGTDIDRESSRNRASCWSCPVHHASVRMTKSKVPTLKLRTSMLFVPNGPHNA